uniref:Uncharacterized protein n=1 Tax=Pararge aegeria TaxID=116150 RepID=S4P6Q1_9NEOP
MISIGYLSIQLGETIKTFSISSLLSYRKLQFTLKTARELKDLPTCTIQTRRSCIIITSSSHQPITGTTSQGTGRTASLLP